MAIPIPYASIAKLALKVLSGWAKGKAERTETERKAVKEWIEKMDAKYEGTSTGNSQRPSVG